MNIKKIICLICLVSVALMLVGCKDKSSEPEKEGCTHSYSQGICEHCGEKDPDYKPADDSNDDEKDEQKPGTEPEIPSKDLDGVTDLPFVPAK